jgi:hypothetical protein
MDESSLAYDALPGEDGNRLATVGTGWLGSACGVCAAMNAWSAFCAGAIGAIGCTWIGGRTGGIIGAEGRAAPPPPADLAQEHGRVDAIAERDVASERL